MIQDNGWYRHESDTALRDKLAAGFPIGDNDASFSHYQDILDDMGLSNKRTALDIGAYTGAWSTALSNNFNEVHAFEASTDNCECFSKNVENKNNITLYNVFIHHQTNKSINLSDGEQYNIKTLNEPADTMAAIELINGIDFSSFRGVKKDNSKIPIKEIDEYNFADVDLINLHTNGSEYLAIMGAIDTITRCRPAIIYQVYEDQTDYYSHRSDTCTRAECICKLDTGNKLVYTRADTLFILTPEIVDEFITSLGYSITTVDSFEKWGMTYRIAVPD